MANKFLILYLNVKTLFKYGFLLINDFGKLLIFSDIDFSEPKVIQDVDLSTHLRGAEVICIFVLNYHYLADPFL